MVMRMIVVGAGLPVSVIYYDKGEGRERTNVVCTYVLCVQSVIPGNIVLRCSQGTSESKY